MKSEDVDKLFKERLGQISPSPSADLWNRLQSRMEEKKPEAEEKKPVMMWARSYAVAAAITVLLSAGVVFFKVQQETKLPQDSVAQTEQPVITDGVSEPEDKGRWINKGIAAVESKPSETTVATVTEEIAKPEVKPEILPAQKPVNATKKVKPTDSPKVDKRKFASANGHQKKQETVQEQLETAASAVAFASTRTDMNASPVEIIIKRSVAMQAPEAAVEAPESDVNKKQELVKNIFKQVKNLSNGEQVNLSELGLHADRIAFETQIGKQKISKVINL